MLNTAKKSLVMLKKFYEISQSSKMGQITSRLELVPKAAMSYAEELKNNITV